MKKNELPQIKEIADALNLSPTTVSFVLNGYGDKMRIAKKTQERVRQEAQKRNYRPNIYARRLRTRAGGLPDYVIACFWNVNLYVDEIIGSLIRSVHGFEETNDIDLELIIQPYTGGRLSEFKERISADRYSGIIFMGLQEEDMAFLEEQRFRIPIVVNNRHMEHYPCMMNDDFQSGIRVAKHFYDKGIMKVGVLLHDSGSYAASRRMEGFMSAARQYGMTVLDEWVVECRLKGTEGGYTSAMQALDQADRPEGLFCMYGTGAAGVLRACEELEIRVPQDMEVVAYGDVSGLKYTRPSVSVIHVPVFRHTEATLKLLIHVIECMEVSATREEEAWPEVLCEPEFLYRESSPAPAE